MQSSRWTGSVSASGQYDASIAELRKNNLVKIQSDSMVSQETEDATTRHRVMRYVMAHGWTTSNQLASELDLTAAAIRRHLSHLESAGLLIQRSQPLSRRHGAGRPAKEYAATAEGRERVSHAYDMFAIEAVETLARIGGSAAVTAFFEERFRATESRFVELMANNPTMEAAEALSQALTQDGFMAGLAPVGGELSTASAAQLCQHNCPYTAVAVRFPELCAVETSVFARLLDSHVQRLATIAHGDGVCTTHIPALLKRVSAADGHPENAPPAGVT